jgi:hypothetical protein
MIPEKYNRKKFLGAIGSANKYALSIRPTHKEFGFNGIRFSMYIFNTEKEIDFAAEVMHKELA